MVLLLSTLLRSMEGPILMTNKYSSSCTTLDVKRMKYFNLTTTNVEALYDRVDFTLFDAMVGIEKTEDGFIAFALPDKHGFFKYPAAVAITRKEMQKVFEDCDGFIDGQALIYWICKQLYPDETVHYVHNGMYTLRVGGSCYTRHSTLVLHMTCQDELFASGDSGQGAWDWNPDKSTFTAM